MGTYLECSMKVHCVKTENKTKNHQAKELVINKLKEDNIYRKKNNTLVSDSTSSKLSGKSLGADSPSPLSKSLNRYMSTKLTDASGPIVKHSETIVHYAPNLALTAIPQVTAEVSDAANVTESHKWTEEEQRE